MKVLQFTIRTGGNLMTFGPAGIGKTEMAMQACENEKFRYVYLNLSVLEAPDMIGLPLVENGKTTYAPPETIPLYNKDERPVILLVDEVDKAKPELQNPCLELFQFRAMNGRKMNIHAVIATGNLPDEGAFSLPVSHALTNRCGVYRVTHAFEPWQEWATGAGVNPLIVGFLSKNQEQLLMPPPEGDSTAYCHPSPRAWTLAAKDLDFTNGSERHLSSVDFQTMLVAGRVGMASAVKFKVWLEHYRHIEPLIEALVREGKHPDLDKMEIDRQFVCAISAVNAVAALCRVTPSGSDKEAHERKLHKTTDNVFGWLRKLPSEFCIGAAKSVMNMKMIQDHKLTKVAPFMEAFLKIRQAMKDE
jgi:hypothetical protein